MPGTRSSARQAAQKANSSSPNSSQSKASPATGSKRKTQGGAAGKAKKGKRGRDKEQTTIEYSMPTTENNGESKDVEMKDDGETKDEDEINAIEAIGDENNEAITDEKVGNDEAATEENDAPRDEDTDDAPAEKKEPGTNGESKSEAKENGFDTIMSNAANDSKDTTKNETTEGTGSKIPSTDNAVESSSRRASATPSSILEKGLIYFFFRGRVGIDEPSSPSEIARSYLVLRPIPHGAKLGDGPIGDEKNVRMLAVPKKVLPISPKDRFMVFVEKTNTTLEDVKNQFSSSDYATKTVGVRHTPAAAPVGEGVYAFTKTGRETHLAYILTIPEDMGDVQEGVGLRKQGSYITSAKNPTKAAPAGASLPKGAEYPKEILDEFGGRGWMPLEPKLLEYENTQFLLIGHKDDALEKATKPQGGENEKGEKETLLEELEKLEEEDEMRVEGLKGDDAVFTDLGLSAKEYPKLQTTW